MKLEGQVDRKYGASVLAVAIQSDDRLVPLFWQNANHIPEVSRGMTARVIHPPDMIRRRIRRYATV